MLSRLTTPLFGGRFSLGVMNQERQLAVCKLYGSLAIPPMDNAVAGVALRTLNTLPLNGLRHPPEEGTSGWFIWGGEELSSDRNFFSPLHVSHLQQYCPAIVPFLALAPGWRVLVAPGQEEVWYDIKLLKI